MNKKVVPAVGALVAIGIGVWVAMGGLKGKPAPTPTPTPVVVATPAGEIGQLRVLANYVGPAFTAKPLQNTPECSEKRNSEEVLVVDGKLANVLVRVVDLPVSVAFAPPERPVVVDQTHCMYRPRVQGILAGGTVTLRNSDQTSHNVHTYVGQETCFNRAQPTTGSFDKKLDEFCGGKEGPIKFSCDVHPWMTGYVVVSATPYFAVTGENGMGTISLPVGKYTLEAWHEKFGTQRKEVEVGGGWGEPVAFDFGK